MTTHSPLVEAVRAAIVASAHLTAYARVSEAFDACHRLGTLSTGRWRAAARDLERLQEELENALPEVDNQVARGASEAGVELEALWTAGEAAGVFDTLREDAEDYLDDDSLALRLLDDDALYGATFLDDSEVPNRGTTLLFGWGDPLFPAAWQWEGNWVLAEPEDDADQQEGHEELDLFELSEVQVSEHLLTEICQRLEVGPDEAAQALSEVAAAFTRASLVVDVANGEEAEADEEA